jgi:endonuclease YncB( thermonuclease family)
MMSSLLRFLKSFKCGTGCFRSANNNNGDNDDMLKMEEDTVVSSSLHTVSLSKQCNYGKDDNIFENEEFHLSEYEEDYDDDDDDDIIENDREFGTVTHRMMSQGNIKTKKWSLCGQRSLGKIVKVIDGDTVHAVIPFEDGSLQRIVMRINGIDAPELRRSSAYEKTLAIRAKNFVESLILNKKVVIVFMKSNDKYGRELGCIFYCEDPNWQLDDCDDLPCGYDEPCNDKKFKSISPRMIENRLAVSYFGSGPKQDWNKWVI